MKKMCIFLIIILFVFISMTFGMSNTSIQPKFDCTKDYHHFYPYPGFTKSLVAICLARIADEVKDNIDTKDPLASKALN